MDGSLLTFSGSLFILDGSLFIFDGSLLLDEVALDSSLLTFWRFVVDILRFTVFRRDRFLRFAVDI